MVFKLLFVRRSYSSFKIYILEKHKICSPVLSGQLTGFKLGKSSAADVFVQNLVGKKSLYYFRNLKFFNNVIKKFIEFVQDARASKILYIFWFKRNFSAPFEVKLDSVF